MWRGAAAFNIVSETGCGQAARARLSSNPRRRRGGRLPQGAIPHTAASSSARKGLPVVPERTKRPTFRSASLFSDPRGPKKKKIKFLRWAGVSSSRCVSLSPSPCCRKGQNLTCACQSLLSELALPRIYNINRILVVFSSHLFSATGHQIFFFDAREHPQKEWPPPARVCVMTATSS
jgi:hypothetical protein